MSSFKVNQTVRLNCNYLATLSDKSQLEIPGHTRATIKECGIGAKQSPEAEISFVLEGKKYSGLVPENCLEAA